MEITSLTKKAPEPILGVGVRQGDSLVTGELNVSPGTLLAMEVFLDKSVNGSADVYGIGVSHMQVTDTKSQEETIIFNGYLFVFSYIVKVSLSKFIQIFVCGVGVHLPK